MASPEADHGKPVRRSWEAWLRIVTVILIVLTVAFFLLIAGMMVMLYTAGPD